MCPRPPDDGRWMVVVRLFGVGSGPGGGCGCCRKNFGRVTVVGVRSCRTFNVGICVVYLTRTVSILKCPGGVRPSLVPMRDLVPTSNGGRVNSVAGRSMQGIGVAQAVHIAGLYDVGGGSNQLGTNHE